MGIPSREYSDAPLLGCGFLRAAFLLLGLHIVKTAPSNARALGGSLLSSCILTWASRRVGIFVAQGSKGSEVANTKRKGPPAGKVRVKILPKDPLVARRDDLWPVEVDMPCPTPGSGPTGPHAIVIDTDASTGITHPPARLLKNRCFAGLAQLTHATILGDLHFHQV